MPESKLNADPATTPETQPATPVAASLAYLSTVAHWRHIEVCAEHGLAVINGALYRKEN